MDLTRTLAYILLPILCLVKDSVQGPNERRLLNWVLDKNRYNQYERPVKNESDALDVNFGLTLQQIIDVDEKNQILLSNIWLNMDEKNQILNTNLWLNLKWKAYNLAWNKSEYGNIESIRLPADKIWKPDILMYNSADEDIDSTYPTNVVVSHDGSCQWVPPGLFLSTCKIDITWFPFDDQKCRMKFGSWTYTSDGINLMLQDESGDISSFIQNGEWVLMGLPGERNVIQYACCSEQYIDITFTVHIRRRVLYFVVNMVIPCFLLSGMSLLQFLQPPEAGEKVQIGVPGKRNIIQYDCCPEKYIDITFTIHVRRRTLYYGFNLLIPCVLISSMALLTFTLPPDAGEKISLGVTILLSLTVFLLVVAETMPPTSDAVPLIGMYFACIMLMCSLSVVFTVLVLNCHHHSTDSPTIPKWIQKGICGWLAWLLRMRRPGKDSKRTKLIQSAKLRDIEMRDRCSKSLLANVLDLEDDFRMNNTANFHGIKVEDTPTMSNFPGRTELREILKELRFMSNKVRKDEADAEVKAEWRFAATVIDRLCVCMFTVFTISTTFGILFSAPHMIT